ncbi:MAG: sugar-binding transcriptional regulator [Phyllobacterium sp.]|uniref:sugar-binding transcriptional regulator n=1 Tax=Phyllobacterium sp. TaxID=1871046 RepID=UPI0030F17595
MTSMGTKVPPIVSSNIKVKTAWLYYVEGLTQEQIADKLNVSRVKVMRTLAACTAEGVVITTINSGTAEQIALERRLERQFNLHSAIVIPTPNSAEHLETALGHAVAHYLGEQMQDGTTLAIGGGATLFASLRFIERRKLSNATVVGLVGSLAHSRWINPSIVAARVAEAFDIDSYQITAPVIVTDEKLRQALWQQPTLQDVRRRAAQADIALLTVGDISPQSTIFRHGIVPPELIDSLKAKGAVANVLCYFIDRQGQLVDHPINRQVMAIELDTIAQIPNVVIAAGGPSKVEAIRAALSVVPARVLITESETATALLG